MKHEYSCNLFMVAKSTAVDSYEDMKQNPHNIKPYRSSLHSQPSTTLGLRANRCMIIVGHSLQTQMPFTACNGTLTRAMA